MSRSSRPSDCPADDELESLAASTLPVETIRRLESHVDTCSDCTRRLQTLIPTPRLLRSAALFAPTVSGDIECNFLPSERPTSAYRVPGRAPDGPPPFRFVGDYELLERIG